MLLFQVLLSSRELWAGNTSTGQKGASAVLKKILISLLMTFSLFVMPVFAEDTAVSAFVEGCRAYSGGDWSSAIFAFRKAVSFSETNTPETNFMLINAEIYSEDFRNALDDCEMYLENFPGTSYESNVIYMKGRCLYVLGEYDKAVITLSDFCHQYPGHDMYPSSLFWIAESFYACYQYNDAVSLYQRIVYEYPEDAKAPASQYRIETIGQREREEKLLYLLKQTGEEYLFAKEEYEKQLKLYSPESQINTRKKLSEAELRNMELEEKYKALEEELNTLKAAIAENPEYFTERGERITRPEETEEQRLIRELKTKAAETMILMKVRDEAEGTGGER